MLPPEVISLVKSWHKAFKTAATS